MTGRGQWNLQGRDWWYWGSDWSQKIANGDANNELIGTNQRCGGGSSRIGDVINDVPTLDKCMEYCAFAMTTNTVVREKCSYFDYSIMTTLANGQSTGGECRLYSRCQYPFTDNTGFNVYRLHDVYPAGFKSMSLREFNEPPTCIHVPNSSDKKVEVMIETASKDSRVCIMDGNDMGIGTNSEVGNVQTCDNGQLYACFTAATRNSNQDFYFYIYCDGSCEASDVDLWVRIRVSETAWSAGKTSTADDIEMWCEMERGSQAERIDESGDRQMVDEFTWPSELLPDYPEQFPFRISHTANRSSARTLSVAPLALLTIAVSLWAY